MAKILNTTKLIASTTLAAIAGTAAVAQSSWDGFYVGGAANMLPSDFVADVGLYDSDGTFGSVFVGYNMSFGSLVVGAEINTFGDAAVVTGLGFGTPTLSGMVDLKGRVGTTFGSALAYATVGVSQGTSTYPFLGGSPSFDGMNYGVGVDYMVSDNIFVGAEYVTRLISDGNYFDATPLSTISIRAGYKF